MTNEKFCHDQCVIPSHNTGALLGESESISPTATPAPVRLRTVLRPTTGVHDLYFVFTNPTVKDGFLFAVTTATFEPKP